MSSKVNPYRSIHISRSLSVPYLKYLAKDNASFKQDMDSVCKIENLLRERLTDEDKELFIEYINLWGVICGDLELCSYKEGFRHGAKFACDVFN